MKLDVAVSISRDSRDIIRISIEDRSSSITFLNVEMDPASFAHALTGLSLVDATGEVRGVEFLGKKLETKSETIPVDRAFSKDFGEEWDRGVAPLEVEGWKADHYSRSFNHHRYSNGKYKVNFRRYVEAE